MINFTEGKIYLGEKNISVASDYEDLNILAAEGLIEKREMSGGRPYFYAEAVEDSMRFGVFIRLRAKRIEWILLRWLDRPITGWDNASEKAMTDEYRLISNFVKKHVGTTPDSKKTGTRGWRLKWGQLNVSYEIRSFDVAVFMEPQ
ncbi:MAG: hypothetical protein M3Y65_23230 [Pseudomonadota bacterium]|nr:hypothetical protein [Pseudomonadota bacterium]